jgi:argininosuccinate lyase
MPAIWRRRFAKKIDGRIVEFTSSVKDDERLIPYDIASSIAHVRMLRKQKIVRTDDADKLERGLRKILREYKKGILRLHDDLEDVHMNIEHKLRSLVGKQAGQLHTARSRNDLIATDLRLYSRDLIMAMMKSISNVQKQILKNARDNYDVVVPGYTHMQQAQPILWSFYMLSHFFKLQRNVECLQDTIKRVDISPLGSAACAGTCHTISPEYTARLLAFTRFSDNALMAVTDRDYLSEIMFFCTQIMLHIASLAEDIIIFSTREFNLIELDESVTTGSSIMPHKKNPDVCELLRAKTGNAIGRLVSVLTILKGLASSYNRDLQEIKGVFFKQADETLECLEMVALVVGSIRLTRSDWADKENMVCTTDIVDYAVKRGYPFRIVYDIVTQCVRKSQGELEVFITLCAGKIGIERSVISHMLKPKHSVMDKRSRGSTSCKETKRAMKRAQSILHKNESYIRKLAEMRPVFLK